MQRKDPLSSDGPAVAKRAKNLALELRAVGLHERDDIAARDPGPDVDVVRDSVATTEAARAMPYSRLASLASTSIDKTAGGISLTFQFGVSRARLARTRCRVVNGLLELGHQYSGVFPGP